MLLLPAGAAVAQFPGNVYVPINPCRVADTSQTGAGGPIQPGAINKRGFKILGPATNYASQGGSATGCGIPGLGDVQGVFFNIVAKNASGAGNLRGAAGDNAIEPAASTLNFQQLSPKTPPSRGMAPSSTC